MIRAVRGLLTTVSLCAALAACGGGGDGGGSGDGGGDAAERSTTTAVTREAGEDTRSTGGGGPGPAGLDGLDLCALFPGEDVEAVLGGSWTTSADGPSACRYEADDAQLTLAVHADGAAELDRVRSSSSGSRFVEELDAFASGAVVAVDPATDTYQEVWARVGAAEAMSLAQRSATRSNDELLALFEAAALAYENRPLDTAGDGNGNGRSASSSDGRVVAVGDLDAVRFEIDVPATGRTLELVVTADDVVDAASPASTQILCVDLDDDGGLTEATFAVLAMDGRNADGLRLAALEVDAVVDGAGSYPGGLELSEADGDRFEFTGTVTIEGAGERGSFELSDRQGAEVVGTWRCERS